MSEDAARGEGAGTALGRMFDPRGNADLYEAGVFYEQSWRRYMQAKDYKMPGSASDFDRMPGYAGDIHEDEDYIRRCQMAIETWREISQAVRECGDLLAWEALDAATIEDRELRGRMRRALTKGLEAVSEVYSGGRRRRRK
jgi:hypothetical protein